MLFAVILFLILIYFYQRIVGCFHSCPAADWKSDHRENVSEIYAEYHRDILWQFICNDPFRNIRAHLTAIVKSAEHHAFYFICAVSLQQRLKIAVEFIDEVIAHNVIIFNEQNDLVRLRHKPCALQ